jgi:hypothetical protein
MKTRAAQWPDDEGPAMVSEHSLARGFARQPSGGFTKLRRYSLLSVAKSGDQVSLENFIL